LSTSSTATLPLSIQTTTIAAKNGQTAMYAAIGNPGSTKMPLKALAASSRHRIHVPAGT